MSIFSMEACKNTLLFEKTEGYIFKIGLFRPLIPYNLTRTNAILLRRYILSKIALAINCVLNPKKQVVFKALVL